MKQRFIYSIYCILFFIVYILMLFIALIIAPIIGLEKIIQIVLWYPIWLITGKNSVMFETTGTIFFVRYIFSFCDKIVYMIRTKFKIK